MSTKVPVHLYALTFVSTAERIAYAWSSDEVGRCVAFDTENGQLYHVIAAGAGAASMAPILKPSGFMDIDLYSLRLVTSGGAVGNIAAIGGVTASNSAPIARGDSNNSLELSWATGAVGALGFQRALDPNVVDVTQNMTLELDVYSGSTDAATFTVATSFNGGTETSYTASDASTKSATVHQIAATILAADIPASPKRVTVRMTPGTHGTNAIQLCRVALRYGRK